MGEAKNKRNRLTPLDQAAIDLTHKLVNDGKLIEGGFAAYIISNKISISDPALPTLYDVYMSGAEHLWQSVMATLDPGTEETPADMRRMDSIHNELDAWRKQKMGDYAKSYPTKGNA